MMYVIQRVEDGKYVNQPGSHNSYTRSLSAARIYGTRGDAERDCCGNERVREIVVADGKMRLE